MASIDGPLPSGHWRVRWRDPGGKQHSVVLRTKKEAQAKKVEIEFEGSRGVWRDPKLGKQLVSDYVEEIIGQSARRASTRAVYRSHADKYILPALGQKALYQVNAGDVRKLYRRMEADGRGVPTIDAVGRLLVTVFNQAVRDGAVAANPARGVPRPRVVRKRPSELTAVDVLRIANAIDSRYRVFVLTAAFMGLRIGETAGLRMSSIDFDRGRLFVREQVVEVGGRLTFGPPKTETSDAGLGVPPRLLDELYEELTWNLDEDGGPGEKFAEALERDPAVRAFHMRSSTWDPLVFTTKTFRPISRTRFNARQWKPAIESAGISSRPKFHELRHFQATLAVAEGAHGKVIQERLRHASYKTTMDVYAGLMPGLDSDLVARLDAAYARAEDEVGGADFHLTRPLPGRVSKVADLRP